MFELGHGGDEFPLCGRDVIVEEHVADGAGVCLYDAVVLHRIGRDDRRRERDRARCVGTEVPNLEFVGLPELAGIERGVQHRRGTVGYVGAVHGQDARAAT